MGKRKNNAAPSQNFVVERILDRYIDELGNKWFYLKWLGYPEEQATWEPEQNVDCTGLIKDFEKKFSKKTPKKSPSSHSPEWSLKQATGSSTKIVLKKINLETIENCSEKPPQQTCSIKLKLNGDHVQPSIPPQRKTKRRRSSAIGTEVGTPKKRRGKRKKTSGTEETTVAATKGSTEEYMVEAIHDKCLDANGRILYLIKWIGYDSIYNTWEPVENLNCPELLQEFNLKNKHPKVIVSKILEKRKIADKTEYLVKISGCRKQSWMYEHELQCSDLLDEFNREYNRRNSKLSLADIADNCSSSESEEDVVDKERQKPKLGGVKINRECTTSSDEDTFSPIRKKSPPVSCVQNGKTSKLKVKSRTSSNSSSDSNLDFEDFLSKYNESVRKDSAPPSPPTLEETLPDLSENKEKTSEIKRETSETQRETSETNRETSKTPAPLSTSLEKISDVTLPNLIHNNDVNSRKPQLSSPFSDNESDQKNPLVDIPIAKFELPQLIIPKDWKSPNKENPKPRPASPDTPPPSRKSLSPNNPSPPVSYPSTLTSDRGRDFSKELPKPSKPAPLASYLKPMRCASDDSDSDDNLSDLESKLAEALQDEPPAVPAKDPEPDPVRLEPATEPKQESGFTGVDLGALIFTETDKTEDTSVNMSGLLDTIVSQTVTNSLQSAFMNTSVTENNQSHSELFEVVAQHSVQLNGTPPPSEKEIDNVLGELYATASNTGKDKEDGGFFEDPQPEVEEEENMEPLDPPLSNIVGRQETPSPPARTKPPSPVPFSPLAGMLSTFTKPSKKTSAKTTPAKTTKPKKTVLSVRTFSKKTPVNKVSAPVLSSAEDIFADMGSSSHGSKRHIAANNVPCPYCSRKFKDKSKLDFHISFKHPQMLELACDNCGEFFQSAIEYQCHQLTCGQD